MASSYKKALFIFRRDLRLEDNTGLIFALKNASKVVPCFIFTPEQIEKNSYRGLSSLQFMKESLEDLERQLKKKGGKLFYFYGEPSKVVAQCIEKLGIDLVALNKDYTPYSTHRDQKISKCCQRLKVDFHAFDDALLHSPESCLKNKREPYVVFTPFFRNALKARVEQPQKNRYSNYATESIRESCQPTLLSRLLKKRQNPKKGGRTEGLKILKKIGGYKHYQTLRDYPARDMTTHLSPHLKFTTVSPREVYWAIQKALGTKSELIRALYWRDFFTSIGYFFPEVFKGPFHQKFSRLKWNPSKSDFRKWCEGKTGFPIVDAGMRELNETGVMHNRVRMVVASFLIKDLHIDWRWGERYFAQHLLDYDPAVNNGNWQWCASTGCDSQPYFRIFNPWLQQKRFDPDCDYIKQWVPELKNVKPEVIHRWFDDRFEGEASSYVRPMIDHSKEAKSALADYRRVS